MADTVETLILDLLEWVDRRERTYDETMDAWRTSCPRLPVWEDANERGTAHRGARARPIRCLRYSYRARPVGRAQAIPGASLYFPFISKTVMEYGGKVREKFALSPSTLLVTGAILVGSLMEFVSSGLAPAMTML
jgi:hypothetical protein